MLTYFGQANDDDPQRDDVRRGHVFKVEGGQFELLRWSQRVVSIRFGRRFVPLDRVLDSIVDLRSIDFLLIDQIVFFVEHATTFDRGGRSGSGRGGRGGRGGGRESWRSGLDRHCTDRWRLIVRSGFE